MDHRFEVGDAAIVLAEGDLTRETTDAIVNAANRALLGGGGVDGAIHRAAGPELLAACRQVKATLPGGLLFTGKAVATPGFRLPARHVIHVVGPIYDDDRGAAPGRLASCYTEALALCRTLGAASVAFPAVSTGVYGYPLAAAAKVSLTALRDDLRVHGSPKLVRVVLFGETALSAFVAAANELLG
jgi:O-acetyl-ADP-ribose deacetylase (regulator of RNase III)